MRPLVLDNRQSRRTLIGHLCVCSKHWRRWVRCTGIGSPGGSNRSVHIIAWRVRRRDLPQMFSRINLRITRGGEHRASLVPATSAAAVVAQFTDCVARVFGVYSSSLETSLLVSELLLVAATLCSEVPTFRAFVYTESKHALVLGLASFCRETQQNGAVAVRVGGQPSRS
jgi:hypothetical protein